jgi:uncharacterized membrane-anchored protein YjiN (DUF445 family)
MKGRASLLLLSAAVLFVTVRATTDSGGAWGYVEAAAEAAMVGGVADWFAVTALFRHPLGIPIPHTAIVPTRKDQIGRALGDFVQGNFLEPDVVAGRLRDFGVSSRLGAWMRDPDNASRVAEQTSAAVHGLGDVLDDEDVATGLEHVLIERLGSTSVTPAIGRVIEVAVEGGHDRAALDALLRGLLRLIEENRPVLRERLGQESPWWVPEAVDNRVFDRLMGGVHRLVADMLADPDHELREHVRARLTDLAEGLKSDPAMLAHGEEIKRELLDHPEVRAWLNSVWAHLKDGLVSASDDPSSQLRLRLEGAFIGAGARLEEDPEIRSKVDGWIESIVRYLIEQSGTEVADLIATTVTNWDAESTSERIEVQVGRDLQFIRINGTVVGGMVGIVIHAVAQLL